MSDFSTGKSASHKAAYSYARPLATITKMDKSTARILIFTGIALTWSFTWFSLKHLLKDSISSIQSIGVLFLGLIPTIGLIIGGLLFRQQSEKKEISIAGNSLGYSIIIVGIPIICLTFIGVENVFGIQSNVFGAFIGIFTMTYAFLEEYGWRGYLQVELSRKFNKWIVYIIVGIIWYSWHWYFLREGSNAKLIMIPILIAASAGIGEIAKSTKSILICAAFHGIVNILFIYGVIANQLTLLGKIIILAISLIFWIPLIRKLEKQNSAVNKT